MISLTEQLSTFDLVDTASGVGGLQLLPANADHLLRFERLAQYVAAVPGERGTLPRMSSGRWRTLINTPPIADEQILGAEDPYEETFTSSITFYGGSYIVIPGLGSRSAQIVQRLAQAIFRQQPEMLGDFADEARLKIRAILTLSNLICRRVPLRRYEAPIRGKGLPAVVPRASDFDHLKAAVIFDRVEIEDRLGAGFLEVLKPFVIGCGESEEPEIDCEPGSGISATPILEFDSTLVVIAPTSLLTALRHWLIVRAGELGVRDDLARRYREVTTVRVTRSLFAMGFRPMQSFLDIRPSTLTKS